MKTIKDMPEHSRPREKLREKGLMNDLLTGKVRVNVNTSMENVLL